MENFIFTATNGNDWTEHTLEQYNIQVIEQSSVEFFNLDQLPPVLPALQHFCKTTDRALAPDDDTRKLLHYLDLVLAQKAAAENFTVKLLDTLGYVLGRRVITIHQTFILDVWRTRSFAYATISIREKTIHILVLQQAKEKESLEDIQPQLIAGAIAAYQRNRFVRKLSPHMTIPCIALVGTCPIFYKIEVTSEFNQNVFYRRRPANAVVVYRHTPKLPHPNSEGMKSLENRATIIQHYQAFKDFVHV